jgi:DNA replication protein DnaC
MRTFTCKHCRQKFTAAAVVKDYCRPRCARRHWWQFVGRVPKVYAETHPRMVPRPRQFKAAMEWALAELRSGAELRGLVLHGNQSGTGKTRTAFYVLKALASLYHEHGTEMFWVSGAQLKREYLHHAKAGTFNEWFQDPAHADVLLVDDCDKPKASEGFNGLVFDLIETRLAEGQLTILTLNASGKALAKKLGEHGEYIVRRLREFALCIDFDQP